MEATTKFCNDCETHKNLEEFGKNCTKSDGLQTYCKPCTTERVKASRALRKDYYAKYRAEYKDKSYGLMDARWSILQNMKDEWVAPDWILEHSDYEGELIVYRCYDVAGNLIYVGRTKGFRQRIAAHKQASSWFTEVDFIRVLYCDSQEVFRFLETTLINLFRPKYNY